jgi:hypothetical protein
MPKLGLWFAAVMIAQVCASQPPPIASQVDFDETDAGMGIAKDRYRDQGIILGCTPNHWLYTVERDGESGHFRRSLTVSPGGNDLYISIEFVVPGTNIPGAVQATDIYALDASQVGYAYEYFDVHGLPANSGSNSGDYRMGEGWYYSNGPVAHRFVFHVGDGLHVFLDEIRFSQVAGSGPLDVQPTTWSALRLLYR